MEACPLYVDSDFLNRIASLERKHAVAHTSSDPQQQQQQQQQVLPVVQHAALGQQQLQQPPVAPGHQPLLQQQPAQGSVPELQVHELAPAEPPAAPVVLPAPPSDGPLKSGWSDTPDSACLAMMDCLEQQAADRLAGAAAGGAGTADGSPVPARQLSFTPTGHGVRAAGAGAAPGSTPLSSGGRPSNLPTSHLGRSALQQAAAAAVAGLQQEGQPALVQAVEQEQQVLVPEQQPVAPALHQHAPPMAQQQQPLAKLAESGQKRSLAASIALEQLAAQHSPAAAARQQKEQPHAGLPPTDQGHASKRLRVGGSQPATQAPLPYAQQQQQQQQQQQNPQAVAAAGGQPPLSAPAPSHAAGPTAVAMEDAAATFDYLCSDDESEDEEADRNLPLLSQYMQSAGRSPQQLRRQQEERRQRAGSRSPGGEGRSPQGGEGAPASRSPLLGQVQEQGQASPLLSADLAMLESYLSTDLAAAFRTITGITGRLYDWQAECLTTPGVLHGKNLIYCAPTSGGKSLVAEVLMLRRILTTNRPAMLVLPFVSICSEKSEHLSKVLAAINKEVKEFYGGSHSHAALTQTTGVIVCTIEKANIIINRMLEDQSLGLLSCLVVDELHMVGEEERGYQLELLLTKLRYAAAAVDDEDDNYLSEGLQIIGMSATLPNVDRVAKWLNAQLFVTDFRPGLSIKNEALEVVRTLEVPQGWDTSKTGDSDHVALLARETVEGGHSVLIFCGTKKACESMARRAARMLDIPERELRLKGWTASQRPTRASLLGDLRRVPGGADPALLECFPRGAAFHHAGLSSEEKDIVETAYRCGAVSVLCATSTLAAGVNLPARRVIIRHAYKGRSANVIDGTCYRQMAGRAGRAGIDTHGECVLINQEIGVVVGEKLFTSGASPVQSCLVDGKKGMKRAMLEVVVSGVVVEPSDVERYIRCTLLAAMNDYQKVADTTIAALRWLGARDHTFIYWDDASRTYQPTPFGKAVLASGLPPEQCLVLKDDLARARQSFVMTTELHLTYLCVPVTESLAFLDWKKFEVMLGTLSGPDASVATKVGVDRAFVMRVARGMRGGAQDGDKERICKRFWMALILTDIIAEASKGGCLSCAVVDVLTVQKKYAVGRGEVQNLQDHAARFASMVAAFCERLGWYDLEALIVKFQSRVLHGVRPEILALSEIPFVKAYTARLLYRAGLRTPEAVAAVENVDQIVSILANQQSSNPDSGNPLLVRRQALKILRGARELLNRRARELREQAEAAFKLVESADRTELAHGEAEGTAAAAGADDKEEGEEEEQREARDGVEAPTPVVAARGEEGGKQAGGAAAGAGQAAGTKGRGGGPTSGRSARSGQSAGSGGAVSAATAAAAAPDAGSDGDGEELLEAAPEPVLPPDPWQYGAQAGVHCLDTPDLVRQLCSVVLAQVPGPQQLQGLHQQHQGQQQQQQQRHEFFGFHFDTVVVGSAAGAAALLPKGPTAAQRRDHALHDRQSAGLGVRLEGVAVSWRSGQAFYVPLHRRDDLLAELRPLFWSAAVEKATWDLRGQLAALAKVLGPGALGVPGDQAAGCPLALRDPLVDVRVAAWLGTPDDGRLKDESSHSVGSGRKEPYTLSDMLKIRGGQAVWAEATQGMQASTAASGARRADAGRRAAQARKMWQLLRSRLRGDELLPPLWRTEMPLEPMLQRRIEELEGMAHAEAGQEFSLSSPQEVSRILFEVLKLAPPPCAKDLKSGGYSTGQEVLLELHEHPIARLIFEHRKLRTLLNRQGGPGLLPFVQGFKMHLAYAEAVSYPGGLVLKRIRGSINQTCRLAMDEPNLQCVPKPRAYKVLLTPGELGSAASGASAHADRTANLRAAFVAPPGCVLLSADYRQIEFRLMAHFSGDPGLARVFSEDGADPFRLLAAQWLGAPQEQARPRGWLGRGRRGVTQQQRDHAKQLTYGLLYGMGAAKLADELGCSVAEARTAQEKFRASMPGIEAWQARVVAECRRLGYVETLAGRRRYLPNINCRDGRKRAAAERQAKNTVCQGSAADLAKAAMVAIHTRLAAWLALGSGGNCGCGGGPGGGPAARLVLQIHDEFLLEVAEPLLEPVARLVRDCMEGLASGVRLRVPLRVRLAAGPSWGELQPVELGR
ncbi:hypothetical protein CHLNCDRAFT_52598 [Chlorella variabilis]|uniref:DNA-directed DNA polymerase n=1 Tax=Chlorella variabilis TaxID=554065 RepID=E1ZG16_CHLVA|nr:hypothetical protein CHLNCDRAFT_52598 [Chlorella variabilis]EFN55218.1 hypothetical protein CHLNCDRAFT_52598 [Chlorella variabilis]|eukprot:XP_005847320.1 hypothetical protein CHLNCDRAFT_52598 [Chlorella variabilis]